MSIKDNMRLLDGLNILTESDLDLNNISVSAKSTLKEALMFLNLVKINIDHLNITDKNEAYALNNALATNLSISCELSLKALYLYEQQNSGKSVNELWADLRNPKRINPNLANKTSGHALNVLVGHLSNEVRTLINYRVRMLDKDLVEKYPDITFVDMLLAKGFVSGTPFMSDNEYDNDLIAHKETFVSSRYGGQAYSKPDLKFLYHLAMQLSTIARFFIEPTRQVSYNFNFSHYANKVPSEVVSLYQIKPEYITDDLITLFVKRGDIKAEVLRTLLENYQDYIRKYPLEPLKFYYMISAFDVKGISDVFGSIQVLEAEQNNDIVGFLNFCIMARIIFKEKVEEPEKVKFCYIDYITISGAKKFKLEKFPEPVSVVEFKCDGCHYVNDGEGEKHR